MILYKSKFLEVNYLELQHLTHFLFSDYASYMDGEGVYHEMLNFLGFRIHKRSRRFYLDLRNIEHLIDKEFFPWFEKYILPKLASFNADKVAYLLKNTSISDIPERKITLFKNRDINVRFFDNPAGLMQWMKG